MVSPSIGFLWRVVSTLNVWMNSQMRCLFSAVGVKGKKASEKSHESFLGGCGGLRFSSPGVAFAAFHYLRVEAG